MQCILNYVLQKITNSHQINGSLRLLVGSSMETIKLSNSEQNQGFKNAEVSTVWVCYRRELPHVICTDAAVLYLQFQ